MQLCLECDRISTLLQTLDFTPTDAQKTLIFTSSLEERDMVYKVSPSLKIAKLDAPALDPSFKQS